MNKECLCFGPTLGAHPRHGSMRKLSTSGSSAWRAAVQKMTGKKDGDAIEDEAFYSTSSPVGDKGYSALCKWLLLSTILVVYLLSVCWARCMPVCWSGGRLDSGCVGVVNHAVGGLSHDLVIPVLRTGGDQKQKGKSWERLVGVFVPTKCLQANSACM